VVGLSLPDAGPFLARLVRLDRAALVRLRPNGPDTVRLWGRVPWGVLVTRVAAASSTVDFPPPCPPGPPPADTTYSAAELLDALSAGRGEPSARDAGWRWPVPAAEGEPMEAVPAGELVRLGAAAAETVRAGHGRVGERVLRDAVLDHVGIVVESAGQRIEIRQRLVQAALRMAFVTADDAEKVTVRIGRGWVGLAARRGAVWEQTGTTFPIRILR
jgi:hypothetical protein